MAGEPAPLAAVQAAVLKTAASKQAAAGDPAASSQAGAVAQDLAVMADQAKGYAAGVNQGVIVAQDNRAAQNRRIAEEAAQAAAERSRALQLEQMQTAQMRIEGETAAQRDRFQVEQERLQQAKENEGPDEIDLSNSLSVLRHATMSRGPRFQAALAAALEEATNPNEAVAILRNSARHGEEWAVGIKENVLRSYAQQYFRALEGKAISLNQLNPKPAAPKKRSFLSTTVESAIRSRG